MKYEKYKKLKALEKQIRVELMEEIRDDIEKLIIAHGKQPARENFTPYETLKADVLSYVSEKFNIETKP